MTQDEIRAILSLADNHQTGCGPINELFDEHISHVDERIAELTQLKTQLTELRQRCLSARPDAKTAASCMACPKCRSKNARSGIRTWADCPLELGKARSVRNGSADCFAQKQDVRCPTSNK